MWCWRRPLRVLRTVNSKGSQPWTFIGRTDTEAPILWPPDAKSWLIGKDPDAGKDRRQKKKGKAEVERIREHHQLNGHEFEQILRDNGGQRSFAGYIQFMGLQRAGYDFETEQHGISMNKGWGFVSAGHMQTHGRGRWVRGSTGQEDRSRLGLRAILVGSWGFTLQLLEILKIQEFWENPSGSVVTGRYQRWEIDTGKSLRCPNKSSKLEMMIQTRETLWLHPISSLWKQWVFSQSNFSFVPMIPLPRSLKDPPFLNVQSLSVDL